MPDRPVMRKHNPRLTANARELRKNMTEEELIRRIREKTAATHGQAFADSLYRAYIADERYLRAVWEVLGEADPAEWLWLPAPMADRFRETVLEENV